MSVKKEVKAPGNRVYKYKSSRKKSRKGKFYGRRKSSNGNGELPTTSGVIREEEIEVGDEFYAAENVSVMQKKIGEPVQITPIKNMRKRKRESAIFSTDDIFPGYKIIKMNYITKCPNCGTEKTLELKQNNKKKKGMCKTLVLYCTSCEKLIKTFETSKTVTNNKMPDINLRSVVATTSAGGRLTTLRRMCTDFNFPQPVNEHPYSIFT